MQKFQGNAELEKATLIADFDEKPYNTPAFLKALQETIKAGRVEVQKGKTLSEDDEIGR